MSLSGPHKPLIFYTPGARGDFFGRVLTNDLANNWQDPTIYYSGKYYKLHNAYGPIFKNDPCTLGEILNNYSIRIRLNSINDVLTVTHNVLTKIGLDPKLTETLTAIKIIQEERNHRKLDSLFKHIVNFQELSKPAFLLVFAHQFSGKLMDAETMRQVKHNIGLQQQVNLDNYQNYLNIDIKEVLKFYELGNGFN